METSKGLEEDIKRVAPGTPLREALDNIVRAKTGALIVLGDGPEVLDIVDGGVRLDAEFSPSLLYELSKMDGAIIVKSDLSSIVYANAQLWPKRDVPSLERGIRHRTAQRMAVQTNKMVIAISERRNTVTLYRGHGKYVLKEISFILSKANQALQTLSNYRAALDRMLANLDRMELESQSTLGDVVLVLRRMEMMWEIVSSIERYIIELGTEGYLVKMQMDEVIGNNRIEHSLVVLDYSIRNARPERVIEEYRTHGKDVPHAIIEALGYQVTDSLTVPVSPKGYRLLKRIPRLPGYATENLIRDLGNLSNILAASEHELDKVEGIGVARAKAVKDGLMRLHHQARLENP